MTCAPAPFKLSAGSGANAHHERAHKKLGTDMSGDKRRVATKLFARLGQQVFRDAATRRNRFSQLRPRPTLIAFEKAVAAKDICKTLTALRALEAENVPLPPAALAPLLISARDDEWALTSDLSFLQAISAKAASLRELALWAFFAAAHNRHPAIYDRLLSEAEKYQQLSKEDTAAFQALEIILDLIFFVVVDNRDRCLDLLPCNPQLLNLLETANDPNQKDGRYYSREGYPCLKTLEIIKELRQQKTFEHHIQILARHYCSCKNYYIMSTLIEYLVPNYRHYPYPEGFAKLVALLHAQSISYFDIVATSNDHSWLNQKDTRKNMKYVTKIFKKVGDCEREIIFRQIAERQKALVKLRGRGRSLANGLFRNIFTSENSPQRELSRETWSTAEDWGKRRASFIRRHKVTAEQFVRDADSASLRNFLLASSNLWPLDFLVETNRLLDSATQPRRPVGVIVLFLRNYRALTAMPLLSFYNLKLKGFALISLAPGILSAHPTDYEELNALEGVFENAYRRGTTNAWEIDLVNGRAVCKGINFFQGLEEVICCHFRRYTIDYRDLSILSFANKLIADMDASIECIDKLKGVASKTGIPIKVFVKTVHCSIEFAARHYVSSISENGDLELFQACTAYENYFSNFNSPIASTLVVQNMTRHPSLSQAHVPPREEFEHWYKRYWPELRDLSDIAESAVSITRVKQTSESIEKYAFKKRVVDHRKAGGPAICLFGKVLFDQGVPIKGGAAHAGMKDWFDHTIKIARDNPNLLLLIKPHPHELRNEIALYPNEMLEDWMPAPRPENIIFLPHDMFNLHEVANFTDLGLVWNGSASMELGVLGVPCIVASLYGDLDFPVGHILPKDLGEYEQLLRGAKTLRPGPEVKDRSRALIHYLRSENVSIPYRYTRRTLTNLHVSRLEWIEEDLERFRTRGDPYVDRIADRIAR